MNYSCEEKWVTWPFVGTKKFTSEIWVTIPESISLNETHC